jgi:hypothetical protein
VISLPSIQGRIVVLACPRLLRKVFYRPGKEIHDQLSRFPFTRCVNHSSELYKLHNLVCAGQLDLNPVA